MARRPPPPPPPPPPAGPEPAAPPPPPDAAAPPPAEPQADEFRLVPLDCPSCGAAVAAEGGDVVFYCTACRNGYRFDEAKMGLEPIEVSFVAAPQVAAERYLPFWLLPAEVTIHRRDAGSSGLSGLLSFFTGGKGGGGTRGEGTFAVPAFDAPLAAIVELARTYTLKFPELGERLGERLTGGCHGPRDAETLARYALIATEVAKPDLLRDLEYEVAFRAPRLLGVPFARRGEGWADALYGVAAGR